MRLNGIAAIDYAEAGSIELNKYADPTESAREGLTVAEARAVAAEDPALIWVKVAEWDVGDRVESGEIPADYDTGVVREILADGQVTVAWDSGMTTDQHWTLLRQEGERPIDPGPGQPGRLSPIACRDASGR